MGARAKDSILNLTKYSSLSSKLSPKEFAKKIREWMGKPGEMSGPPITKQKANRQRDLTSLHIHTEKRSGSATPENDGQNAATTQIMQQLMTQLAISFLENGKYSNGSSVKPESELVIGSVLPLYSLVISSPFYMRLSTRPLYIRLLKISIFLLPKMSMNSLLTVLLKYSVSVTR